VWDGTPAGGLGGTADVVEYARQHDKEVKGNLARGLRTVVQLRGPGADLGLLVAGGALRVVAALGTDDLGDLLVICSLRTPQSHAGT
jgi:hypothetical protein